jgi:hypothetical protein
VNEPGQKVGLRIEPVELVKADVPRLLNPTKQ